MEYYRRISGRDVWVTVQRPLVYDEAQGVYIQRQYCCLFKLDVPPAAISGEYLRLADAQLRWFDTDDAAREAAFDMVAAKIEALANG